MSEENLGTYSCVFEHGAKMDFVLAGTFVYFTFPLSQATFILLSDCLARNKVNIYTSSLYAGHILHHISHSLSTLQSVPYLGEVRDKPIISYVGDSVVMICKMDEKKSKPVSWNWYKENGTNKVSQRVMYTILYL